MHNADIFIAFQIQIFIKKLLPHKLIQAIMRIIITHHQNLFDVMRHAWDAVLLRIVGILRGVIRLDFLCFKTITSAMYICNF